MRELNEHEKHTSLVRRQDKQGQSSSGWPNLGTVQKSWSADAW